MGQPLFGDFEIFRALSIEITDDLIAISMYLFKITIFYHNSCKVQREKLLLKITYLTLNLREFNLNKSV